MFYSKSFVLGLNFGYQDVFGGCLVYAWPRENLRKRLTLIKSPFNHAPNWGGSSCLVVGSKEETTKFMVFKCSILVLRPTKTYCWEWPAPTYEQLAPELQKQVITSRLDPPSSLALACVMKIHEVHRSETVGYFSALLLSRGVQLLPKFNTWKRRFPFLKSSFLGANCLWTTVV